MRNYNNLGKQRAEIRPDDPVAARPAIKSAELHEQSMIYRCHYKFYCFARLSPSVGISCSLHVVCAISHLKDDSLDGFFMALSRSFEPINKTRADLKIAALFSLHR